MEPDRVARTRVPSGLLRLAHAVRDGWLIGGLVLLLFIGLETGYRVIHALRQGDTPVADSTSHPYFGEPWWPELQRNLGLRRNRFDPYRSHSPVPLATRYVNIDSLGHRVTPQPPTEGTPRRLFLLGGSTAWGFPARDSGTIGAHLAALLRERGLRDVEVVNLAQAAFNTTQETITLLLELARGRVPALAVFLDGYNDVATASKFGEPGHTYGDEGIQQQIDLGRRGFWQELAGLGRHSALIARLRAGRGGEPQKQAAGADVCGAVAGYYRGLSDATESLGREYGFPVLHFLQPYHDVSRKPRTRWERALPVSRLGAPCMASIDSAQADRRGASFFSLTDLFDSDTASVFLDANAHLTEAANRRVAGRIADAAVPLLARGRAP